MHSLLILIIGAFFLTIGDIIAKKWTFTKNVSFYIITLFFYLIGLHFLVASYKFQDIAVASITLEILNILILLCIGKFLYKERISKTELLGITTGIVSILILEI